MFSKTKIICQIHLINVDFCLMKALKSGDIVVYGMNPTMKAVEVSSS
jgi:hypothetical protein